MQAAAVTTNPTIFRSLGGVSVAPDTTVALQNRFFGELPEMVVRWQAEAPSDLRLLVLNERLAAELGLEQRPAAEFRRTAFGGGQLGARLRRSGGPGLRRASVRWLRPAVR